MLYHVAVLLPCRIGRGFIRIGRGFIRIGRGCSRIGRGYVDIGRGCMINTFVKKSHCLRGVSNTGRLGLSLSQSNALAHLATLVSQQSQRKIVLFNFLK